MRERTEGEEMGEEEAQDRRWEMETNRKRFCYSD